MRTAPRPPRAFVPTVSGLEKRDVPGLLINPGPSSHQQSDPEDYRDPFVVPPPSSVAG